MAWMCRCFRVDLAESFVHIYSLDLRSAAARVCLHNSVSQSFIPTNARAPSLLRGASHLQLLRFAHRATLPRQPADSIPSSDKSFYSLLVLLPTRFSAVCHLPTPSTMLCVLPTTNITIHLPIDPLFVLLPVSYGLVGHLQHL